MKTNVTTNTDPFIGRQVPDSEPVVMSKTKLLVIALVAFLTGMCFGAAFMLEYIPWL
ncbi:hypothetical protein RISINGSUN_128 [Erwinia phage vB_EamM_RisingSun]|uniref:Uncharacterized protein n=1 Tax=Erwinia phage vB_EamM_RisingSun TaxID=2026080 RepID=A0A223LHT7_9CAUD|nr:hypothetical protein FDI45_gp128 [Erwinia phage vB_EamM_RisingSun]ASU03542.1 hypothetical protein RISINGSUN_128 [Erwinia phage vB_EamM_RisingSun]